MSTLEQELHEFIGTEHYYRHWLNRFVYTDGVKYLAERAGAFWLIDAIASYGRKEPFQLWELAKHENKTATLTMKEDSDRPVLVRQTIKWTDFPLDSIKLYLIDGVLLLPSEY